MPRLPAARLAISALMLLAPLFAQAAVIHVDGSAGGGNNGSSWNDAHTDLQDALAGAGPGDEIWVVAGVYKPTADPAARSATFTLKNNVAIYGGFDGTESARDERNPNASLTVLSGDIDGNDTTDGNGVVVSAADINGANSFHVTTGSSTDATAILDGFTVTAGRANGADRDDQHGGGIYVSGGSPTLTNLRVRGNLAGFGGGMHQEFGRPNLANAEFSGNLARYGGAISSEGLLRRPSIFLSNVTFSANSATINGGGVFNQNGNAVLINVTFSGNRAGDSGGGIYDFSLGGIDVRNAIFWNNQDSSGTGTARASVKGRVGLSSYSLVQGCNPGGVWNSACGADGGNNLDDADPQFVDTPDPSSAPTTAGDVRLLARSPAIDAGNDGFFSDIGTATDLDGNDRLFGDNVDLGPFETAYLSVSLSSAGTGSGSASVQSPMPARFDAGDSVTVAAVPAPNSNFDGWTGDRTSADNPLDFSINTDTALTATFTLKSFEVTPMAGAGGSIDPATAQTIDHGDTATFTITPDTGYSIASVGGTCGGSLASDQYTTDPVTADCSVDASFTIDSFNIGGTVSGLDGDGLELALNDGIETLPIAANGTFQFSTQVDHDTDYTVTVESQPTDPSQTCTVANATGRANSADVIDIEVTCSTDTFSIGGTVTGLEGSGLVLQNNGGDELAIAANGDFTFATALADDSNYDVAVATQPAGQQCTVAQGSGMLDGGNVTSVEVNCSTIEIALDASDLDFGAMLLAQSASRSVTISNAGSPNLVIDGFDPPDAPFTLDPGTCAPLPHTLAAGETCTVELSFQTGIEGNFSDVLAIDSNAGSSPDSVTLRGNAAAIAVPMLGPPGLLLLILLIGLGARPLLQRIQGSD